MDTYNQIRQTNNQLVNRENSYQKQFHRRQASTHRYH